MIYGDVSQLGNTVSANDRRGEWLVLFEQSFPEREKDITDHENLLHQHEKKYVEKLEQAKLEIQKTITNQVS
ncbi:hypothetical protein GLOIN_2v1766400 [Rhizophagus irregularis DAOM 181602=DAOM 197198]|nr:hypothetical protein GLOIN_2v1766400 [Rhizophagus irregularis DAOM 181602=DAOM 197198]